jgi:hypothetical protein
MAMPKSAHPGEINLSASYGVTYAERFASREKQIEKHGYERSM